MYSNVLMDYCDYGDIAVEAKVTKLTRKLQISKIALKNQTKSADRYWTRVSKVVNSEEELDDTIKMLNKQIEMTQRKINGTEIKHKKELEAMRDMYVKWKNDFEGRRGEFSDDPAENMINGMIESGAYDDKNTRNLKIIRNGYLARNNNG